MIFFTFFHMHHIRVSTKQNEIAVLIPYFVLCIILSYFKHWFHFKVIRKSMVRPNLNKSERDKEEKHPYYVFLQFSVDTKFGEISCIHPIMWEETSNPYQKAKQ